MSTYENEWITLSALPVSLVAGKLSQLLSDRFGFAQGSCQKIIIRYFKALRKDISVLIEFPYVDKVFRNSYYHYFSSKRGFKVFTKKWQQVLQIFHVMKII